jgi:ATP-binding cassette subfamily B protein
MKILWKYLRPHRTFIFLSLLLAAAAQLLNLLDPVIFGKIIDTFTVNRERLPEDQLVSEVLYWLLIALGIAVLARLSKAAQDFVMRKAVARFGMQVFNDGLKQTQSGLSIRLSTCFLLHLLV